MLVSPRAVISFTVDVANAAAGTVAFSSSSLSASGSLFSRYYVNTGRDVTHTAVTAVPAFPVVGLYEGHMYTVMGSVWTYAFSMSLAIAKSQSVISLFPPANCTGILSSFFAT